MAVEPSEPVKGAGSPAPIHIADPIDEKFQAQHTEYEEKVKAKVDYSGAVVKTSPEENKLVRKLDIWIMVSCCPAHLQPPANNAIQPMLWLMYWLNYLGENP